MIEIARHYYERTLKNDECEELSSQGYERHVVGDAEIRRHLKWMCKEIMEGRVQGSKARAWIGYIQGEFRGLEKFCINQLRMHTRECLGQEYVCGFAFAGGEVALVTKAKPAWQAGKLNGVGGKVEEGEGILEAMVREFQEETCIQTDQEDWCHFLTLHTKDSRVHFLRAEIGTALEIKYLPEEPVHWYGIIDALHHQPTIKNLGWLIPMARIQRVVAPAEVWE